MLGQLAQPGEAVVVDQFERQGLERVAKMHFKNTEKVLRRER